MPFDKPPKILHLATHFNVGGISSYISIVGSAMTARGYDIAALSSGGNLEPELIERNIRLYRLPIRAKSELDPKLFFALPTLIRIVKRERFDLLHAHTRVTQVMAAVVSRLTGVPYVTTAHGYYKPRFGRRLFGCWGKRVIAISPLVAEELEKSHRVPKDKIRVVYNAVDVDDLRRRLRGQNPDALKKELGIDERSFVIGSVSRLVRDKGHEYLIGAVAQLRKKHGEAALVIVGDGREKKRLEHLIRKEGLGRHAFFVPPKPDITGMLSLMDAFVHPATFREGFGLAMLEAMVAKIPVVATDIWAINSIIRNRVNGFLVRPKSAQGIAAALSFIIENPESAVAVAQNAYDMAVRSYSVDRLVNEMETVYQEVLSE